MPKSKRLHFKDIDSLRFFALIPVFLFCTFYLTHTHNEGIHYEITLLLGYIKQNSLDFFFFISSFLLTSHALREYKYTHAFSLRNFYLRRFFKLAPLLLIGLFFTFILYPWILNILKLNSVAPPSPYTYLAMVPNYLGTASKEQYVYLSVIWTIYMFIQFYILWGLAMKYLKSTLVQVVIVCLCIGTADRIFYYFIDADFVFDTLAYGTPIGIGAILAKMIREDSPYLEKIKLIPKKLILPVYIAGLALVIGGYLLSPNSIYAAVVPFFTCTFYSFVLIDQTFGKSSPVKFRNNKVFSHMGKISFGIIVYQSIISVMIIIGIDSLDFEISSATVKVAFTFVAFVLSWIVADISYNFMEKPLLMLKREFKKA